MSKQKQSTTPTPALDPLLDQNQESQVNLGNQETAIRAMCIQILSGYPETTHNISEYQSMDIRDLIPLTIQTMDHVPLEVYDRIALWMDHKKTVQKLLAQIWDSYDKIVMGEDGEEI